MNTLQLLDASRALLLEVVVDLTKHPDGTIGIRPKFPFFQPAGCAFAQLCIDGKPVGRGAVDPAYDPISDAIDARLLEVFGGLVDRFNRANPLSAGVSANLAGVSAPLGPGQ